MSTSIATSAKPVPVPVHDDFFVIVLPEFVDW